MKFIKSIFNIRDSKKKLLYIILLTFLLSFIVARIWSIYYGHSIYIRGFHIHHFYFGMLLLSVGGILGILSKTKEYLQAASLLIGAGIGLFADEIGLLLNCTTTFLIVTSVAPFSGTGFSKVIDFNGSFSFSQESTKMKQVI